MISRYEAGSGADLSRIGFYIAFANWRGACISAGVLTRAAEDIYAARDDLRAACWAADVRVTRDEQRSHLVTVDVIRRPDDIELTGEDQNWIPCLWP